MLGDDNDKEDGPVIFSDGVTELKFQDTRCDAGNCPQVSLTTL